jgi:tRNA(adenine34) deaminase
MNDDIIHLRRAIQLARQAEQLGNLPIGSVITLDGNVVAEGKNSIWAPALNPGRHAEIEAMAAVPLELWTRANEMILYTTLEPCMMCMSTILIHHIGRIVFGSFDNWGGASCVLGHMPPAFENLAQETEIVGPALPQECDLLNENVAALLEERRSSTRQGH